MPASNKGRSRSEAGGIPGSEVNKRQVLSGGVALVNSTNESLGRVTKQAHSVHERSHVRTRVRYKFMFCSCKTSPVLANGSEAKTFDVSYKLKGVSYMHW